MPVGDQGDAHRHILHAQRPEEDKKILRKPECLRLVTSSRPDPRELAKPTALALGEPAALAYANARDGVVDSETSPFSSSLRSQPFNEEAWSALPARTALTDGTVHPVRDLMGEFDGDILEAGGPEPGRHCRARVRLAMHLT